MTNPAQPVERRQVVRFLFLRIDPAWRRLDPDEQIAQKKEFGETLKAFHARLLLRTYSLMGTRGECDLLLWQAAEDIETIQRLATAIFSTRLGGYLSEAFSYLGMTKRSIYEFPDDPDEATRDIINPSDNKYLFVYPFVKTRAWYQLPFEQRQEAMNEHVRIGRKYPSIRLNTTYSFGLDDQEFVVAFEGDDLGEFLDLVMELRGSEASAYTERDTPIFTCVQTSIWDMLDALGGTIVVQEPLAGQIAPRCLPARTATGSPRSQRRRTSRRARVVASTWGVTSSPCSMWPVNTMPSATGVPTAVHR